MAAKKSKKLEKPANSVAAARGRKGGASPTKTWEMFKSIAGTVAIFLVLRTFLVEAYRIPSGSMIPTMLVGDWLFVNKLRFGPNIPFTQVNLPGYAEPERGDIVVYVSPFQNPALDPSFDPSNTTPTVVKRVIGLAGDTLYSRGGRVHVNGRQFSWPGVQDGPKTASDSMQGASRSAAFNWQVRSAVAVAGVAPLDSAPSVDEWGPIVVPTGHYFMMGDNRYGSIDARYYGFVPRRNIRGRPLFVYYSYDSFKPDGSPRPWSAITGIRWSRLGTVIR